MIFHVRKDVGRSADGNEEVSGALAASLRATPATAWHTEGVHVIGMAGKSSPGNRLRLIHPRRTGSITAPPRLVARGAVFRAQVVERSSAIVYGYEEGTFPVYFNSAPLFTVAPSSGPGSDETDAATRAVASNVRDPAIERESNAQRAR